MLSVSAVCRAREEKRKQEKSSAPSERRRAKAKEKGKAFADMAELPSDRREAELEKLAERLGEDLAALRDEFSESPNTIDEDGDAVGYMAC